MIFLKRSKRRNRSSRPKSTPLKRLKRRRPKAEFIIGARWIGIRPIEPGIGARCIGIRAIERGVKAPRVPIRVHRITVAPHLRRRSRGCENACSHATKENEFSPVHSVIGFKKFNPSGFKKYRRSRVQLEMSFATGTRSAFAYATSLWLPDFCRGNRVGCAGNLQNSKKIGLTWAQQNSQHLVPRCDLCSTSSRRCHPQSRSRGTKRANTAAVLIIASRCQIGAAAESKQRTPA